MAKLQRAVVVEGYTDVMACHVAGVTTAIATCGRSFGAEHIKVLRRLLMDDDTFRGEVIFTFDGDAAVRRPRCVPSPRTSGSWPARSWRSNPRASTRAT